MPAVELRDIVTDADRRALDDLVLAPGQDRFVAGPADSIAEAAEEARACPRFWSVHDRATGELVGFVMISDGIPADTLTAADDLVGPYYLWRLLIDHRVQGRGYGSAVLDEIVAYVRTRPGAAVLWTSCNTAPDGPRPFYLRYGFVDTGELFDDEHLLRYDLTD